MKRSRANGGLSARRYVDQSTEEPAEARLRNGCRYCRYVTSSEAWKQQPEGERAGCMLLSGR